MSLVPPVCSLQLMFKICDSMQSRQQHLTPPQLLLQQYLSTSAAVLMYRRYLFISATYLGTNPYIYYIYQQLLSAFLCCAAVCIFLMDGCRVDKRT